MGGDQGPRSCVSACLKFVESRSNVRLTLIGDRDQFEDLLPTHTPGTLVVIHASAQISMSEKPAQALRRKRDSSMALAVRCVAEGSAQACMSAGNTGALMAFGLHYLKMSAGIDRPAICKAMPSSGGCCYLLDIGANAECSADNLLQFAQLGVDFARHGGISAPKVGLLNMGTEAQKGAKLQRQAAELIAADPGINFIGFVEGGDIYGGVADVVVCDGFSGNVLLKASEGAARLMRSSMKQAFMESVWTRLSGLAARPVLAAWQSRFDPSRYNGAVFLGLNGVVVKSHGAASEQGFINALQVAYAHAKAASSAEPTQIK